MITEELILDQSILMAGEQNLGGARHSSPLEDEMSYPLTKEEFLTLEDSLCDEKLSNWETLLLSTGITSLVSFLVILCTGSFIISQTDENNVDQKLNVAHLIIVVIYGIVSFGSIISFFLSIKRNKTGKTGVSRLRDRIKSHLGKA